MRIRRPGKPVVTLVGSAGIPVGSTVDARDGEVFLTAIPRAGAAPERAKFWDGIFRISQASGITTLTLTEQLASCSSGARAAQKKPKTRRLWGDGKGKFRTKGRYSAATVRGTKWLVTDGCRYTRTRVSQGVVTVTDGRKRDHRAQGQVVHGAARPLNFCRVSDGERALESARCPGRDSSRPPSPCSWSSPRLRRPQRSPSPVPPTRRRPPAARAWSARASAPLWCPRRRTDGPDTIVVRAGAHQLTNGQLVVDDAGRDRRSRRADHDRRGAPGAFRVLSVAAGVTASVTRVTLRDGQALDENGGDFLAGGIVVNRGTLTLDRVRITGGIASSGGGLANLAGTVTLTRSLVDANTATIGGGDAGGLLNFNGGTMTVRDTTLTGNTASNGGGAYHSWGDVGVNTATFERVTIAGNRATGGGSGGVSHAPADTLRLRRDDRRRQHQRHRRLELRRRDHQRRREPRGRHRLRADGGR